MEYGLLGKTLGHSYSKPIHNLLADYSYELYAVDEEALRRIMEERSFRGLNVTIPYKKDVLPYLDEISDEARLIGSANTLVMGEDGRLRGYNTDLYGFLSMADRAKVSLAGKKVVILGSGGTSLTAQAAARRQNAREVVVVSRRGPVDYAALYRDHANAQVIVNTTPVGMYPGNGASPVRLEAFPECEGVLDVVYNPFRTALLLEAQKRNIPCANGLMMLVAQAHRAAELFTGGAIPEEKIAAIHARLSEDISNLVLIGMPGSGKSSIGEALARAMNRPFVDLDQRIEEMAGKSIPRIFEEEGEEAFRRMETEAARTWGKEKGQIIAAGGGSVTREETMDALRQNGKTLLVSRPLERLATQGRPLSAGGADALRALEARRRPLYLKYADATISNVATLEEAARAAREAFHEAFNH